MRNILSTLSKRFIGVLSPSFFGITFLGFFLASVQPAHATIKPYDANKFYWQYNGAPVLLLGGSKQHSLFQISNLQAHLQEMKAAGANYVRNVMDSSGSESQAFLRLSDGKYDLNQWNNVYWTKFENLLRWSRDLDIIVQIEVWDRFAYARIHWDTDPYNPANNINYTTAQSQLATSYPASAAYSGQPFFATVPALDNNTIVLQYQQKFIDKMLSISLNYPNVLYTMDNETEANPEWGKYWSLRIKSAAAVKGKTVYTTEMWDNWNITAPIHKQTLDFPNIYSFSDISQNTTQTGQVHWDRIQWLRSYLANRPWPINTVKIYGGESSFGTTRDAIERFWRQVIGGVAGSRFHRPGNKQPYFGLGLRSEAKAAIGAARKLETMVKMWEVSPSNHLLSSRATNEAYLAAKPGEKYALYFTNGGSVKLNLNNHSGSYMLRWINIQTGNWGSKKTISGGRTVTITAPSSGHWAAAILRANLPRAPVVVTPSPRLFASPTSFSYNSVSTSNCSSSNITSCTASNGWSGSKSTSGPQSTGNLTTNRTCTLTCTGPVGSTSRSVTVPVGAVLIYSHCFN